MSGIEDRLVSPVLTGGECLGSGVCMAHAILWQVLGSLQQSPTHRCHLGWASTSESDQLVGVTSARSEDSEPNGDMDSSTSKMEVRETHNWHFGRSSMQLCALKVRRNIAPSCCAKRLMGVCHLCALKPFRS